MEKISNAEKWELLKQAVEAARIKVGKEISSSDVLEEIPYGRGQFELSEVEEAIYLLTDDRIPESYQEAVKVADRFLKREATIGELRQAVKAIKQIGR